MDKIAPLSDFSVLLVGFPVALSTRIRADLIAIGVRSTGMTADVEKLVDPAIAALGSTHLLVNLDSFDDLDSGVDTLLGLRRDAPDTVVVLCSADVGDDDFGPERAMICDATLQLPLTPARLGQGLWKGMSNNVAFRARREEAAPAAPAAEVTTGTHG